MKLRFVPCVLWFALLPVCRATNVPPAPAPALASGFWPAVWIAAAQDAGVTYGVYHFRKAFTLPAQPASFVVHVSADNRFQLFVNGAPVGRGPARGDPMHWRYETFDLAPHLRAGRNVLAAKVWNAGEGKPMAQMSVRTAFVVQAGGAAESMVNTDDSWRVQRDPGYRAEPVDREALHTFIVSGDGDRVDAARHPWGWAQPDFDDHAWSTAAKVGDAVPYGVGTDVHWWLVPDRLPPMQETLQRLAQVRRTSGVEVTDAFLAGTRPVTVPAHARATLLLDQSFETNAYPTLTVSGGRGASVRVSYAEALFDDAGQKGHRTAIEGRHLRGNSDVFLPDGGAHRAFTTLWFRTFRYVEIAVETADEPLTLEDFFGHFTSYPFPVRGAFASDDPGLKQIWEIGWRTARLCAHETYFDCPYYEQLQYIADTRIQSLISLYVSGDDRLMRNAIELFDDSRIAEGLTQSRYPSATPQFINTFSLFWTQMVRDYWMHRTDDAFVSARLPGMRTVLDWFERRIDATSGILGPVPFWAFVDWPDEWPWREQAHIGGEPPGAHAGGSAILTLQFAMTLRDAAEVFAAYGDQGSADHYRALATQLNRRTLALCWDNERKLVADTAAKRDFSQHANVFAVLSGAIEGDAARDLMQRVANDPSLVQASYYFRFYLLRAMKRAGLGDQYVAALQPWRDMIARGLTTFAERQEPTRSDCHAWSASPCYELLATVCGIEPASPGFKTVRVAPHLGPLTRAEGTVPTTAGDIHAQYQVEGSTLHAEITLPPGLTGEFLWHGTSTALHPGPQTLTLRN